MHRFISDTFVEKKTSRSVPRPKINKSKLSPKYLLHQMTLCLRNWLTLAFLSRQLTTQLEEKVLTFTRVWNYIMSGGNSESTTSQTLTPVQRQQAHHPEDLQAKLTDLSAVFQQGIDIKPDKSKKTVMKNLDQFLNKCTWPLSWTVAVTRNAFLDGKPGKVQERCSGTQGKCGSYRRLQFKQKIKFR